MTKNTNISRTLEKVANRQQHFSIRKLTIGATSVLLGTTLWLGTEANIAHADTPSDNGNDTLHEATESKEETPPITENTKVEVQQTQTAQNEQKGVATAAQAQSQGTVEQNNSSPKVAIANNQNSQKVQNVQSNNSQNGDKNNNQNDSANNINNDRNSVSQNEIAQSVSQRAFKTNRLRSVAKQNTAQETSSTDISKQDLNVASLGSTGVKSVQKQANSSSLSLLLNDSKIENKLLDAQNKSAQSIKQVSDWNQLVSAANDQNINDIQITQNIDASANLQLNRSSALTIESAPASATVGGTAPVTKYTLNLGSNAIDLRTSTSPSITLKNLIITGTNSKAAVQSTNSNAATHFENVDVNGTPLFNGKGSVYIDGQVSSHVNGIAHSSRDDLNDQFHSLYEAGISTKNWYNANILADNVFVDPDAQLTINRDLTGDGIIVEGGLADGTGQKKFGSVNVGNNAQLDITLKNGHDIAASTEQNSDIDNANAAIYAPQNGQFKIGANATVNIWAGHGRGIIFDEPTGGTSAVQEPTMGDWARIRTTASNESNAQNDFELGDHTSFNVHSRDGILLGNHATLKTGQYSKLDFDNHGNGIGLQLDAVAKVEVGPYTDFEMTSDGKNNSGDDHAGNYIGLGDNAQFTVDHDATFRYKLTNTNSSSSSAYYTDAFNVLGFSRNPRPTINIEQNAVFDGEDDLKNYLGEILSFGTGSGTPTLNIDNARYFNLQRDASTTDGRGNIFYSLNPCTINIKGNGYNVYKWSNGVISQNNFDSSTSQKLQQSIQDLNNSSSEYWTDVKSININNSKGISTPIGTSMDNAVGKKHQWAFNDTKGNGFDFANSQRIAIVGTKTQTGTVNVIFHDTTNNTDISGYGPKTSLTGDEGTAVSGYDLDNQISALENLGYVRDASSDVPTGDLTQMPATYTDGNQTVYINMKHGVVAVSPSNPGKPGQPINVSDPNGPKYPEDSNEMSTTVTRTINYVDQNGNPVNGSPDGKSTLTQTVTFTASGYLDKVTGHWVSVDNNGNISNVDGPTWSENDSHNFAEIDSKATITENGQTLNAQSATSTTPGQITSDGKSAKAISVNHNTGNIVVTVTYGPESPISYQTEIRYDASLKPGQIELYQQGKNGIKDSTGKTITAAQNEIIYIGPQTATINYLEKDGNNAPIAIKDASGSNIVGTATGAPVVTNGGSIEFDSQGNTTPARINYNNQQILRADNTDLQRAEQAAGSDYKYDINRDDWSQAVNLGTDVYDNQGLTKSAIVTAAEKLQAGQTAQFGVTNGPVYNVVLFKSPQIAQDIQQISITQKIQRAIEYKNNANRENINDPNGADRNIAAGLDNMSKSLLHGEAKDEQSIILKGVAYLNKTTGKFVNVKMQNGHPVDANGNYIALDTSGHAVIGDLQNDGTIKARLINGKTTSTKYVLSDNKQGTFKWSLDNSDAAGFASPTADHYTVNPGSVPALDGNIKTTATFVKDAQGNTINDPTLQQVMDYLNNESAQDALQQAVSQDVITDASNYPQMPQVPSTQYIFDQFRLSNTSGNTDWNYVVTLAVDRDNPSGPIHVYVTNPGYSKTYISRTAEVNNYNDPVYYNNVINGDRFTINVNNWGGQNGDSVSVNVNNGFTLKHIFGYGVQSNDVSNSWGDYKPRQVSQTINYIDEKTGKPIQGYPSVSIKGLTGQNFNADGVNKLRIFGYTFDSTNSDTPTGTISDYQVGHTYTRTWYSIDGTKVTEHHTLTNADGTMHTVVYVGNRRYTGTIAPNGYMTAGSFQIQNPWVKSVSDVNLRYKETPVTIDQNQAVNYVVYTPNAKGTVNVIFHDTTTNTDITGYGPKTPLTGDEGTAVTGYTPDQDITTLEGKGYVLDITTPIPTGDLSSMPAKYTDGEQTVYINLKHKLDKIDSHNPHGQNVTATVTRQVNYTIDGVADSSLLSHTETVTFNATGYYDEVTNKIVDQNGNVSQLTWTYSLNGGAAQNGDSTTFTGYAVPTKDGYHVNNVTVNPAADKDANADDTGLIKDLTINTKSHDVTININLTKDASVSHIQNAEISVIDEDNDNSQLTNSSISGQTDSAISFKNMAGTIQNYLSQGYKWDYASADNTRLSATNYAGINFGNFDNNDNTTQNWTIYLKHKVSHVDAAHPGNGYTSNQLQRTVTTDISYVDQHGNAMAGMTPVHETVTFNGQGDYDQVTHNWVNVDQNGNITGPAQGLTWNYSINGGAVQKGETAILPAIAAKNAAGYTYENVTGTNDPNLVIDQNTGALQAHTVTRQSQNTNLVVHFTRKTGSVTVTFRDDDLGLNIQNVGYNSGNQNVGTQIFYNPNTDQSSLENQGYVYVRTDGTLPTAVSEGNTAVVIHMRHGHQDVSATDPQAEKTIKRSIIVTNPDGTRNDLSQTLQLHRSAVQDQVTKQITYGNWNTGRFAAVTIPVITGYTSSQTSIPAVENVSANYADPNIQIAYTKNDSNQGTEVINYIDPNGQVVGNQVLHGTIGSTHNFALNVPDGYDVGPNQSIQNNSIHIRFANRTPITNNVSVTDHLVRIDPDKLPMAEPILGIVKHPNTATILPGTKGKYAHDDLTYGDLHEERSRGIIIINPDGSLNKSSIAQTVAFKRWATIDAITGKITFDAWQPVGSDRFDEVTVPTIAGYTPTQSTVAAVENVPSDYAAKPVVVRYNGDPTTQTIRYHDQNGQVISTQTINGHVGQDLALKPAIPDGYQLIPSEQVPKQVKLGQNNKTVDVTVQPVTINIDPDEVTVNQPISSKTVIPGTTSKHLAHDITYQDLNKDVTRTITIKQPDGTIDPNSCTQTVHFTRTATINGATDAVTYSRWVPESSDSLAPVTVPPVAGYTASTQVPAVSTVTSDYKDPQIVVSYTPNEQKRTVIYQDEQGHVLSQQVITGKTDQTVKINPSAPDGYTVDSNSQALTQVKMGVNSQAITITVAPKQTVIKANEVTPTKPISTSDILPGTINKHPASNINYQDLNKDVQRQIIVTLPNGQQKSIVQTVHFERETHVDNATGKVTFGDWTSQGSDNFAKVSLPTISGYIPTNVASEIDGVTDQDTSQTVKINYLPDTPANRLQIAKNNLKDLQQAQDDSAKKLTALQNIAARAGQTSQATQTAYQKQQTLVKNLAQKSSDLQNLVKDLQSADEIAKEKAAAAQRKVNELKDKLQSLNNQKQAEQNKLNQENAGLKSDQEQAGQINDDLATVQANIAAVKKEMAHAQEILDLEKDYIHASLSLSSDYIDAIKNFQSQCDQLYKQVYEQDVAKGNGANARADAFNTLNGNSQQMVAIKNNFYNAIKTAGYNLMTKLSGIPAYKFGGIWNKEDAAEKVDLTNLTEQQKKEINDYTFALLNNIRTQLGLKPLHHSSLVDKFANAVARGYLQDGHSIFNIDAHDAKAVNDAAYANGLDSFNLESKDYVSHEQKYEDIASWYSDADLVILPDTNGTIKVMLYSGDQNDYHSSPSEIKNGQTNMDSIKQGIFGNMLQMLLEDGLSSWGHTVSLLNLGSMKDYKSSNPQYFLGTSISMLMKNPPESLKTRNLGGYTDHFLNVSSSDAKATILQPDDDGATITAPTAAQN